MRDTDKPAPVSFKKLKTTKSDVSGVGKVREVKPCSCPAFIYAASVAACQLIALFITVSKS